jgi:hypothetical protein
MEGKQFFFEKKNQKTFASRGWRFPTADPNSKKKGFLVKTSG